MKYFITLILLFGSLCAYSQHDSLTIKEGKKMLQGLWKVKGDDSITLAISGDSALEYKLGETEMGIFDCSLSKKPCDNEEVIRGSTGLYFTLGDEDEESLCAPLEYINNREFKLVIDGDSEIIFEKIL